MQQLAAKLIEIAERLERERASDHRLLAQSGRALVSAPATDGGVDVALVDFSFEHLR